MKKRMAVLVVLVCLAGCATTGPTETVVTGPAGVYTLVTVDGEEVPATVSHGDKEAMVLSGRFTINGDGTCLNKMVVISSTGRKITRELAATYTQDGSRLNIQWAGGGETEGTIDGDTFTMENEGMVFSYKR
ncbi:MAG: hypothetical protein FVQ80_06020 [Planctomycetes bacterium]|nr:hypothetical protein [Planctomycetota bacterium]